MDTVNTHNWSTHCDDGDPLRVWYTNLKGGSEVDLSHLRAEARDRYHRAIRLLTRPPLDFDQLLAQWLEAATYAKKKHVAETCNADDWLRDIIQAVGQLMPHLGATFRATHAKEVRDNTLTFQEVVQTIRDEARDKRLLKGQVARVQKGAFGPTYGSSSQGQGESGQ